MARGAAVARWQLLAWAALCCCCGVRTTAPPGPASGWECQPLRGGAVECTGALGAEEERDERVVGVKEKCV